jgi:hypothetical protein
VWLSRAQALQQFVADEEAQLEAQLVSLAARQQLLAGIVLSLPPGADEHSGGGAAARMRWVSWKAGGSPHPLAAGMLT